MVLETEAWSQAEIDGLKLKYTQILNTYQST